MLHKVTTSSNGFNRTGLALQIRVQLAPPWESVLDQLPQEDGLLAIGRLIARSTVLSPGYQTPAPVRVCWPEVYTHSNFGKSPQWH